MENSHVITDFGYSQNGENFKIVNQDYKQRRFADKPEGFWYQINESWEKYRKGVLNCREQLYKANLQIDKTNVLVIKTLEEFDSFHDKYCAKNPNMMDRKTMINWLAVSQDYDGIEIPYYFDDRRKDYKRFWYYPWDVACGCIWNTDIITIVGDLVTTEVYCFADQCTIKPQESTGYCTLECQEEMEMYY